MPGIVAMISENEELHAYSVQKLYVALTENIAQVGITALDVHACYVLHVYITYVM